MNKEGYIIISKPDRWLNQYSKLLDKQKNIYLNKIRKRVDFIDYMNYQGVGREIFDSSPYFPNSKGKLVGATNPLEWDNLRAKRRFAEIRYTSGNADKKYTSGIADEKIVDYLFEKIEEVTEVYELIDDLKDYEIISVSYDKERNDNFLGFDVGFWQSEYSIISDTVIAPLWHPPILDDFEDLIEQLKNVNKNCLFDEYDDALKYLQLYKNKSWGEEGEFEIINICKTKNS